MPAFGGYPVADAKSPGDEISSTYEGRHLTITESDMVHPSHSDGFVDKGDPVIIGDKIVGVALKSAAAAADLVAVDTEGIWVLDVNGANDGGNNAVAGGDTVYINRTTGVLSKIQNTALAHPFGMALGIVASGATTAIAVKVHASQAVDSQRILYNTVTSGAYGKQIKGLLASGQSEGSIDYGDVDLTGTSAGHTYGTGRWLNLMASYVAAAGHIHTPMDTGVWSNDTQANLRVVFGGQHMAILAGNPASMYCWRLNIAAAGGALDSLIAAANAGSVGYVATAGTSSNKVGDLPMADVVGHGIRWVRLYDGSG